MLLKICLISALVVAFEASPFVGQEELEVDRVRIQAAASAPAASPQMDVWRAEERQGRRADKCCMLDHDSECRLKFWDKKCKKHEGKNKCRKERSGCVLKEMTKKEKADECCILSKNDQREYECRERNCSDYKCSLSENPENPMSRERYMCVPEKMTKKEKADQEKEMAEREWDKTCCISGYEPRLAVRRNQHWTCGDRYRSSTPRSNIEEECMLRVCIKPEDGKCFSQLKTDYYN